MKPIKIETTVKKMLADVFTPVGIYLRVRDKFRDTILLESTDNHVAENSYSFIGINAIAGIEITDTKSIEFKLPNEQPKRIQINNTNEVPTLLWNFMQRFQF
jgi:anthranilate synthase component 1